MSKSLQSLKSQVNRARNLTYFGKYVESSKEFGKVIQKVESQIFRINDKILISEWNKLLEVLKSQKNHADNMIGTLNGDFQSVQSAPTKKQQSSESNIREKQHLLQQQKYNLQEPIQKKQRFPFGKEPFKKHPAEDDYVYNRKEREHIDQQRQIERQEKQKRDREWEQRQAQIWPKKEPKKATKKNPYQGYNAFNNKSNINNKGNNLSTTENNTDKRQYSKPWLANVANKKSKDGADQKKTFLKQCYPNGQSGPDSDLIQMLEREVIDFCPNITFNDIAELQKAKDVLQEAVLLPLAMPQLFQGIRRAWKGVLLFGPPGTGKTLLAKAIASTGKTTFFNVTASSLASKWKGQSQKLVRILFQMAKFYAPTTIFIDQIDALASKRGQKQDESSRKVKTQLMTRIDGATTGNTDQNKLIVVIGATNRPWDLDEAIRRRLEKRIYIPLPTQIGRRQMIRISLKDQKTQNIDIQQIVSKTQGYSGADLANLCRQAAYMPMRRKLKKQGGLAGKLNDGKWMQEFQKQVNVPLSMEDFSEAIRNVKPSVGKSDLKNYEEWMKQFGQQGSK